MSDIKNRLSGEKDQDNLIESSKGIVYGLTPISHFGGVGAIVAGVTAFSESVKNSELGNESKYSAELDEIFTQLHEVDNYITETRQNTTRLRVETRSMLDDLRKQLG